MKISTMVVSVRISVVAHNNSLTNNAKLYCSIMVIVEPV